MLQAAPAALGIGSLCRTSTGTFPPGRPPATWLRAWELLLASLAASPEDPASTMQGRRGRETFAEPLTSERAAEARELFFDALSAIHVNVFQARA